MEIMGVGEAPSLGMRKGVVVDLEETIKSIEAATERPSGWPACTFRDVYVGITGEHIRSTNNRAVVAVSSDDREVSQADVRRVIDASKIINLPADRQIIHALPRYFTVDGQDGVADPIGMAGGRLEVDTHIITGGIDLHHQRAQVRASRRARSGRDRVRAAGEFGCDAAARRETRRRRAARHRRRHDRHRGLFTGQRDLHRDDSGRRQHPHQRHLARPEDDARAKPRTSRSISAPACATTARRRSRCKALDGRTNKEVTTAQLRAIVVPRVLEMLRMAKQKIVENVPRDLVLGEVVITGGGALLPGIEPIAEDVFGLPVRVGFAARRWSA